MPVIRLDAATVLLQWAAGGLAFLWVTTRHREVGLGYGWLLRSVYAVLAVGAVATGIAVEVIPVREVASAGVAVARTLAGAAFLGAVTDAMLLGHWYLVQPGLRRALLDEQVTWVIRVWPVEVGLLLVPTGMISVLNGSIDDGWGGTLGWFWVACAVATLVLALVTRAALKERQYSAVMAATGLLYLAILTAFGTDLVARAVLA